MRISGVTSTDLFGGTVARPLAIVRVTLAGDGPDAIGTGPRQVSVRVEGPAVATPAPALVSWPAPGERVQAEVGVEVAAPHTAGSPCQVTVIAEGPVPAEATGPAAGPATSSRAELATTITTAEPGWTMWMVSHFHYDPVWWSTQGQFTEARLVLPDEDGELPDMRTAFDLVRLHMEKARRDPDYKFVLAELDYLKPDFDAFPGDRAFLRSLLRDGR